MQNKEIVLPLVMLLLILNSSVAMAMECEYSVTARGDHYDRRGETTFDGELDVACSHVGGEDDREYNINIDITGRLGDSVGNAFFTTESNVGFVTVSELSLQVNVHENVSWTAGVIRLQENITFDTNPWINPWIRRDFSHGPIDAAIRSDTIGSSGMMLRYTGGESFAVTGYGMYSNQQVYPTDGPWSYESLVGLPFWEKSDGDQSLFGLIVSGENSVWTWNVGVAYGSPGTITSLVLEPTLAAVVLETRRVSIIHGSIGYVFDNAVTVRAGGRYDDDGVMQMTAEVEKLFTLPKGDLYLQGGIGYSHGCDDIATLDLRCFYQEATVTMHVVYAINNWKFGVTGLIANDHGGAINAEVSYRFDSLEEAKIEIFIAAEKYFGNPENTDLGRFRENSRMSGGVRFFF